MNGFILFKGIVVAFLNALDQATMEQVVPIFFLTFFLFFFANVSLFIFIKKRTLTNILSFRLMNSKSEGK